MTSRINAFSLIEIPFDRLRTIRKCTGRAFTLVELLVVAIIALLVSILLPTIGRALDLAKQTMCMSNLRVIGLGWSMYTGENDGKPPILPDIDQKTAQFGADLKMSDECTAAELGTGAQQNLCLLIQTGTVSWEMFLCPSSEDSQAAKRSGTGRKYGFGETVSGNKKTYCDYGFQIPYTFESGGYWGKNWCPVTPDMDGELVIMGDRPPDYSLDYSAVLYYWSANHPNDGESLLYAAGNVRFSRDEQNKPDPYGRVDMKNYGGWDGNNVYTCDRWYDRTTDNPTLSYNRAEVNNPRSCKDTVLYWWGY